VVENYRSAHEIAMRVGKDNATTEDLRTAMIHSGFVDEPRQTVAEADKLVAPVMQRLAEGFANERSGLKKQWDRGDNVSTEDLRVALQRCRSFFDRLLKL
jgi:hypothetical protein